MSARVENHRFLKEHSHLHRVVAGVSDDIFRHHHGPRLFSQFKRDVKKGLIDGLTGLYRVEAFEEVVNRFRKKSGQKDFSGYVVYFDADDLKLLNDNYGHAFGDAYLEGIGQLLQRIDGVSFRVGGDEFVTYVPMQRSTPSGKTHLDFKSRFKEVITTKFSKHNSRSEKDTDIQGFKDRLTRDLNHLFDHFISYCDTSGKSISEMRVRLSFAIEPVIGNSIDDVIRAKTKADRAMQQTKDARKEHEYNAKREATFRQMSGQNAFVQLLRSNTPLGIELATKAANLGILVGYDGELKIKGYIGSMDPNLVSLQDLLDKSGDPKAKDASRFLLGIVAGSPIYRPKDLVVRGTEPPSRGR